jgi:hypothetical protein
VEENGVASKHLTFHLTKPPVSELRFRGGLFCVSFDVFFDNSRSGKFRVANYGANGRRGRCYTGSRLDMASDPGWRAHLARRYPEWLHSCGKIQTETENRRPVMNIPDCISLIYQCPLKHSRVFPKSWAAQVCLSNATTKPGSLVRNKTIDLTLRPRAQCDLRDST